MPPDDSLPLFIALEPSGEDKHTTMDKDDYDAETKTRVLADAKAIKADANDSFDPDNEFLNSKQIGSAGTSRAIFINISDSDDSVGLGLNVIKGVLGQRKSVEPTSIHSNDPGGPKDYSVLLADINNKSGIQELKSSLGGLQRRTNSTDSFNNFISKDISTDERALDTNIGNKIVPTTLGKHQKIETFTSNQAQQNRLNAEDMLGLGAQIPLQSSGEAYIPKFGLNQTSGTRGSQILLALAGAIAPNPNQILGTRQLVKNLSAKEVLNSVRKDGLQINGSTNWPKLAGEDDVLTNGSYNSWIVPFDSITSRLQIPTTVILVSTIAAPILGMAETINGISNASGTLIATIVPGIQNKEDNFVGKVMVGFMTLFGLNIDSENPYSLLNFLTSVGTMITTERVQTEYPWMSVVARQVIKDLSAGIPGDATDLGIDSIDFYTRFLTQSHIVKFVRLLANLGNTVITGKEVDVSLSDSEKLWTDYENNGLGADSDSVSPWNLSMLISNDRVINPFGKGGVRVPNLPNKDSSPLAWGTGTTPSMYLLPASVELAANLAGPGGADKLFQLNELGVKASFTDGAMTTGRISAEDVAALEERLEASYMPFYLQDLRTNEIISFHAFIENMGDSFTANYETQTGFGRVEPIHTYKNSSRDMSLSFRVVSTNEQDHAEMWWKINKLLTLMYPQFTKGRSLENGTEKFIQPYSQLIGASPMVRLRVGDVWKSNFSKFNVMRLFGLGESEFELEGLQTGRSGSLTPASGSNEEVIAKFFKGGTDVDANPIMQAFESTAGQGIAGFIASMNIDWNESRWTTDWDPETDGSRAPQMCKIDIKFLPIHDVTPGLASNGFMTAPVYTVGKYSNAFKKITDKT